MLWYFFIFSLKKPFAGINFKNQKNRPLEIHPEVYILKTFCSFIKSLKN